MDLTWFHWGASCEWVTGEIVSARANGTVIDDSALCVQATGVQTWVRALLIDTSSVGGTLGAHDTLGAAVRWTSDVPG